VAPLPLLPVATRAQVVAPAVRILGDDFRADLVGEAPGAEESFMGRIESTWPKKIL